MRSELRVNVFTNVTERKKDSRKTVFFNVYLYEDLTIYSPVISYSGKVSASKTSFDVMK